MAEQSVIAACTIASPNYLPFVRTLAVSYLKQHPDHRFLALIVAREVDRSKFADEPYEPIFLEDIGLPDLPALAMKYGILELNTNVKPRLMLHLLRDAKIHYLVYLDPDIFVYAPLNPVFDLLCEASAVMTPHLTLPSAERIASYEQEVLFNGTYNLGFLAVLNCSEAILLLQWWDRRCLENGYSEGRTGLFVDQKWMNLVPALFDGIAMCKHPGCNFAAWNLEERRLSTVGNQYRVNGAHELCFFHFSGIAVDSDTAFFRNTDRYTPSSNPELVTLFSEYKAAVRANRRQQTDSLTYGFDRFDDGTVVTLLARRIYAAREVRFRGEDPFCAKSGFYKFACRTGLLGGKVHEKKVGWTEFQAEDKRVEFVHKLLRLGLRVLGPNRYELFMRYLGHISVLRNQASFLADEEC